MAEIAYLPLGSSTVCCFCSCPLFGNCGISCFWSCLYFLTLFFSVLAFFVGGPPAKSSAEDIICKDASRSYFALLLLSTDLHCLQNHTPQWIRGSLHAFSACTWNKRSRLATLSKSQTKAHGKKENLHSSMDYQTNLDILPLGLRQGLPWRPPFHLILFPPFPGRSVWVRMCTHVQIDIVTKM